MIGVGSARKVTISLRTRREYRPVCEMVQDYLIALEQPSGRVISIRFKSDISPIQE
jgi:hypothetical protein